MAPVLAPAPSSGTGVRRRLREERSLVLGVRRGEEAAARRLVERYRRPVLAMLARMTRDPVAAEDLAQQTFADAFAAIASFDPVRRFSAWLFTIAANKARDHRKSRKRSEVSLGVDVAAPQAAFAAQVADPESACLSRETAHHMTAALALLPAKYREVIVLKDLADLSYEEMESFLRLPTTTLKMRALRAREMLREAWETLDFLAPAAPARSEHG